MFIHGWSKLQSYIEASYFRRNYFQLIHYYIIVSRTKFPKFQKHLRISLFLSFLFKNNFSPSCLELSTTGVRDKIEACSFFNRRPIGESEGSRAERKKRKKKKKTRIRDFYRENGRRWRRGPGGAFQSAVTRCCQRASKACVWRESGAGTRLTARFLPDFIVIMRPLLA